MKTMRAPSVAMLRAVLYAVLVSCAFMGVTARAESAPNAAGREPTTQEAADGARLFEQGLAAFEAGNLPRALDVLTRAHALAPNYRSAAVLGQVELELGQYVGAATHLDESVRLFPRGTDHGGFGRVMEGLSEARRHVCTLRVQSPTRDAELFIDGKPQGRLPIGHDLYVEPGRHQIEVRAPGHASEVKEEDLPSGEARDLRFELAPLPGIERDAPAPGHTATAARAVLWTGGALTVLGLGTGAFFELSARQTEDEARRLLRNGDCTRGAPCPALTARSDRATSEHDVAGVAFISAGALGIVTVSLYALLGGSDANDTARSTAATSFTPWLSPTSAGIGISGGFR